MNKEKMTPDGSALTFEKVEIKGGFTKSLDKGLNLVVKTSSGRLKQKDEWTKEKGEVLGKNLALRWEESWDEKYRKNNLDNPFMDGGVTIIEHEKLHDEYDVESPLKKTHFLSLVIKDVTTNKDVNMKLIFSIWEFDTEQDTYVSFQFLKKDEDKIITAWMKEKDIPLLKNFLFIAPNNIDSEVLPSRFDQTQFVYNRTLTNKEKKEGLDGFKPPASIDGCLYVPSEFWEVMSQYVEFSEILPKIK